MLQVAVIKIMRLFVYIILPLLTMQSCMGGFDGPDVVTLDELENDIDFAVSLTILKCTKNNPDQDANSTFFRAWGSSLEAAKHIISLGGGIRYVTKKDRDFCIVSLLTTPCTQGDSFVKSLYLNQLLYCNPANASLWQNQHFGQGEWSMPRKKARQFER